MSSPRDGRDALAITGRLAPERVLREQRREQQRMDAVLVSVLVHQQFFENDLSLALHLGVAQCRSREHVAEQLDAEPDVLGRQPAVVRGVFLGGEGIHLTADAVDGLGDVVGRARLGALEEEMLEEMRDARVFGRLVARTYADPHSDRYRLHRRHPLRDDTDARRQRREANPAHR